ncbi:MAG: hypothetical protein ABIV51_06250, partial [Saprospiraceae bacterium]
MRYFILLGFLLLLFSKPVTAQAPNQFNFQGVLRNTSNQLLSNVSVGMRVTILLGSSSGTVVYQETYSPNPKTNDNGLITLEVGTGVVLLGNFSAIDWSAGSYYIRTEADPGGGNLYSIQGVAQLLSVPYALYSQTAKTAPTVKLNDLLDVNTNGVTAGQVVKWNGTVWSAADDLAGAGGSDNWGTQTVVSNSSLSGNGTASFPLILASQGASNGQVLKWSGSGWAPQNDADAQALTIAGQTLSISGGNSVTIPSGADNSPTNEIQSLTLNGGNLTLSLGGGTVFLPDNSPFNELQVLNLNGNTLSLLPAGGSVTLSNNQWGTFGDDIVNTNIGSVGIGTGNPASKLHVYASTGSGIRGEAVSGFGIYGKSNAGSGVVGESIELSGVSGNSTNGNGGFFRTTNGVALRAEGKVVLTGFVGIGTEDPTQNLSVNGTAGKPG